MEDPIPYDPPPPPIPQPNPNSEVGMLPIPPLDPDMFTSDFTLPSGDEDFPFDDLDFDFTVDDLTFADDLLMDPHIDSPPDPPGSDLSHARSPNSEPDLSPNVARVYDCSSPEPIHGPISSGESNIGQKLSCPSPEAGSCKSNSAVSQDSGNTSDRDVSSSSFVKDCSRVVNHNSSQKVKDENMLGAKCSMSKSKRKKEQEQEHSQGDDRSSKFRRSSIVGSESANFNAGSGDEDERRKARLMRNRESAQLSRQRKKQYVEELEDKVRSMHSTITDLNSKIMYIMSENAALRQQLSGGAPPLPPPGMYPMGPMPYPWVPCPPYMLKPQGSQVPLVPIPRLKPQPQPPTPAPKVSKKSESNKKSDGKTKKVASVSLLGLLFFFLLFGGLVPMVSFRYGGVRDGFGSSMHKGAVLMVDKHGDRVGFGGGMVVSEGKFSHGRSLHQMNSSDGVGPRGNASEPLVASLYVPRNDKLVKIDGNLIIHSVLASERAMASRNDEGVKTSEETSLAIPKNYPPYPIPETGRSNGRHPHLDGRQRALAAGSSDELKPAGSDGKLQQWFREGHTGPMLSSGMCTEVFQFDISPHPGAIVPATSIVNTTTKHRQNSTRLNKPRNRRILHEEPIPFDSHTLNATKGHRQSHEHSDGLKSNSSSSSMVVSVLVDPREAGDGNGESVIRSKASRIFVVVLVDSVKYVTYSCMLPFVGSGAHLVTA